MFDKLLSTGIKIATLPVRVANAGADIITGGDGSKSSRTTPDPYMPSPLAAAENLADRAAEAAEEIDE